VDRKQEEAEFHDRLRGIYEQDPSYEYYTSNKRFYSVTEASRLFVDDWLLRECRDRDVLDYGCGSGETALTALPVARSLHGIDISAESVAICIEKATAAGLHDKASFSVMDAERTSFADDSFDVLYETGVLHHLSLESAFEEMRRVLRPGGRALCLEALRHNPIFHSYRKRTPHLRTVWETQHILGEPEIDSASKYFGRIEKKFFHLFGLLAVPLRNTKAFGPTLAALTAVDRQVLRVPGLRRQAWMCAFTLSDPIK
jgi:ubiquinone/menaquinone biosynthesis C-methylase UbiE